jgi:hypothetical protein
LRRRSWRVGGFLAGKLAETALSPVVSLFTVGTLGLACVFLVAAWQFVPQRLVAARQYALLTQAAEGRIVASWLALELNPAAVGNHSSWEAFSQASRCAVVEYAPDVREVRDVPDMPTAGGAGSAGGRLRRAFCGTRFPFDVQFERLDLYDMAPRVPFAWGRDASGFVVPEVRLSTAARLWLASHPEGFAWPDKPPPPMALAALRLAFDRPLDAVVVGWSEPMPAFPLVLDPRHPEGALPAGYVARQRDGYPAAANWLAFAVIGGIGLVVWFEALGLLLRALPRWAFWLVAIAGLTTLPWWAEEAPGALRHLNRQWGDIVEIMLTDLSAQDRLLACDPADATLAHGDRLVWRAGEGGEASTFWRLALQPGLVPPAAKTADAALAALADHITAQVRTLAADERLALFQQLGRAKQNATLHAGLVFLPAAREAILDPGTPADLRRSVRDFLWAWVLTPDDGMSSDLAGDERLRLNRLLLDVPIPEVANMAHEHWGKRQGR